MNQLFIFILFIFLSSVCTVDLNKWELFEYNTVKIAVRDNIFWRLSDDNSGGNHYFFAWDHTTQSWIQSPGAVFTLAVSPTHTFCINTQPMLHIKAGTGPEITSTWFQHELARDIKVGNTGYVWYISNTPTTGGYEIVMLYDVNGLGSQIIPGGATKVAPTYDNKAFIITDTNNIKYWDGSTWIDYPGQAQDIVVGSDGIPWIVSMVSTNGGYFIMKWDAGGQAWKSLEGIGGVFIALDSRDNPYIVSDNNIVYRPKGVLWNFCRSK